MDWSKAKNILLVVFITLNIILLYNNYTAFLGGGQKATEELTSDTVEVLNSRGVNIKCKIPPPNKGATVIYGGYSQDKVRIADVLLKTNVEGRIVNDRELKNGSKRLIFNKNGFSFTDGSLNDKNEKINQEDAEKVLKETIESMGLPFGDFKIDREYKLSDNIYMLEYNKIFEKYIFYDNYIQAQVGADGIKELNFKNRNVRKISANPRQKTIEAYKILLKMQDISNSTIEKVDMGYMDYYDKQTNTTYDDVLAWRIVISGRKPDYYSAVTGKKLEE
ncbi:MAG: two-component system regulatory protein YycI [Bacillota bacterium]|nr:two-component system regulatory protein YycI [Bacillota bacterium]